MILVFLVVISSYLGSSLNATPLIALREAQNCDGCHRGGRGQRPFIWRRCSLDCQGCHADPSGAGPRNEWGYWYENDQAAVVNFIKPLDPLDNQGFFDIHYDGRIASQKVGSKTNQFPMSSEVSLRIKPFRRVLSFSYSALFLGRTNDNLFRIIREGDRRYRERYAVMIDEIPLNTYIRAYRGQPMYGLRRPNHTLWIRQRIGLGPFSTTDALEIGGTPNVPYWHYSKMEGDPYVEKPLRQKGSSYHVGFRGVTLGWHINASGWDTKSDTHGIKMNAVGYGANIFDLIVYAETNTREVKVTDPSIISTTSPTRIHPSSKISEYTVAYAGILGVMFGTVLEEYSTDDVDSKRLSYFVDLHPVPGLQLELWVRRETGDRDLTDSIGMLHLYFDW